MTATMTDFSITDLIDRDDDAINAFAAMSEAGRREAMYEAFASGAIHVNAEGSLADCLSSPSMFPATDGEDVCEFETAQEAWNAYLRDGQSGTDWFHGRYASV